MGLIAFEEGFGWRLGVGGINTVDCSRIARGNVETSCRIEGQVPDVMRFGIGRAELCLVKDDCGRAVILFRIGLRLEFVNLATGKGGGVQRSVRTDAQDLHAQVLGFKEGERLSVLANPQNGSWRACPCIGGAALVHSD